MNDELERTRNEALVACFNAGVLFQLLPRETEKNHESLSWLQL